MDREDSNPTNESGRGEDIRLKLSMDIPPKIGRSFLWMVVIPIALSLIVLLIRDFFGSDNVCIAQLGLFCISPAPLIAGTLSSVLAVTLGGIPFTPAIIAGFIIWLALQAWG